MACSNHFVSCIRHHWSRSRIAGSPSPRNSHTLTALRSGPESICRSSPTILACSPRLAIEQISPFRSNSIAREFSVPSSSSRISPVSATRWRAELELFWRTLHAAHDIHEFDRRIGGKSLVPNRHGTLGAHRRPPGPPLCAKKRRKSPMNRRTFYWKLRNSELALSERTLIMGVLNVTPDSFSDAGLFRDPDRAYARALELEEQGADII